MHGRRRWMLVSASRIKAAYPPGVRFVRSECPMLSHFPAAGGTAKRCANWAFVSGVSPVSINLRLIDRIQSGIGTGAISRRQAPCAETGGTGAKATRVFGETVGARHMWDRWDLPSCKGGRNATLKPCDHFVVRGARRKHDLATWAAKPKN